MKSDNTFKAQLDIVYKTFYKKPQTMKMVEVDTGIDRANICRYVRTLRNSDKIAIVKTELCLITKHRAGYLTTNPELFPKSSQYKLF